MTIPQIELGNIASTNILPKLKDKLITQEATNLVQLAAQVARVGEMIWD